MGKQVLSIEQMQHLKELGVDTSKASMCWLKDLTNEIAEGKEIDMSTGWNLDFNNPEFYKYDWMEGIPTFTLQDILDLLPNLISSQDDENNYWLEFGTSEEDNEWWYIRYMSIYGGSINYEEDEHLIDAAYEMLCWCAENGYVKTDKN